MASAVGLIVALLSACGLGKDESPAIQEILAGHPSVAQVNVVRLRDPIQPNLRREYRADVTLTDGAGQDELNRLGADFAAWAADNRGLFDDVWVRIEEPGRVIVLDKDAEHNAGAVNLRSKLAGIAQISSSAVEHTRQGRQVRVVARDGQANEVAAAVVDDASVEDGLKGTAYRLQVVNESTPDDRGIVFEGTRTGIEAIRTLESLANAHSGGGRVVSALLRPGAAEAAVTLDDRRDAEEFIHQVGGATLDPPVKISLDAPKLRLIEPGGVDLVRELVMLADDPRITTVWHTSSGTTINVPEPEAVPSAAALLAAAPLPMQEVLEVSTDDATRTVRGGRDTLPERARLAGVATTEPISLSVDDKGISVLVRSFDESVWERAMHALRDAGWEGELSINGGARAGSDEFVVEFRSTSSGVASGIETKGQRGSAGERAQRFITVWDRTAR